MIGDDNLRYVFIMRVERDTEIPPHLPFQTDVNVKNLNFRNLGIDARVKNEKEALRDREDSNDLLIYVVLLIYNMVQFFKQLSNEMR